MTNKYYSTNITKKGLLLLSIPIFFSNLAIPLTGIIDTGLMGNLGQTKYLAATSIGTSVMSMIIWSFGFLRMGTVGLVAQLYGKSDYREITRTILRNFFLAIIITIPIILFKPLILELIKNFFSISPDTHELITTYVSVRILSIPAEFIIYILVGFYLGIQKTNISSLLIIILSILNIVLSSFFVLSLSLNVFGVALGTLIASYFTAIVFSIYSYKFIIKKFQITPSTQGIINFSKIVKLVTINFDIFLRTLVLTFSFLWVSYLGSKLGEDYLAVNTILMQFLILTSFFLDAYAYSTEGIVGYAYGRKNKKTFLSAIKNSLQLSFVTALIISLIFLFCFKSIINIMTDVDILRFISYKHAIWIILLPPIASFCYQLDGIFVGTSRSKEMRNGMVFSATCFIIVSIYLTDYFGNHGLWFSLIIFMILRSLFLNFFLNRIIRKF